MKKAHAFVVFVMGFGSSIAQAGIGHVDMVATTGDKIGGEKVMVSAFVEGDVDLVSLVKNKLVEMFGEDGLQIPYIIDLETRGVQVFVKESGAWQPLFLEPSFAPVE